MIFNYGYVSAQRVPHCLACHRGEEDDDHEPEWSLDLAPLHWEIMGVEHNHLLSLFGWLEQKMISAAETGARRSVTQFFSKWQRKVNAELARRAEEKK